MHKLSGIISRPLSFVTLAVLVISMVGPITAYADIDACSALFSGSSIPPGTQSSLNIQINNESGNTINWIRVVRPNGNFTVLGASSQDWTANYTDDIAVFTDSFVDPGTAYNRLYLTVDAAASETPPATWIVQASDSPNGDNPYTCSDSGLGLAISDGVAPSFSNIIVEDLQTKSATITWNSDQPSNGQVFYGRTGQYGNASALDNAYTTEHSVTLTGLNPNSAYHFKIAGTDAAGDSTTSGDNTFITLYEPVGSVTTSPIVTGNTTAGGSLSNFGVAIKAKPTEKVAPTISLSTDFSRPFKQAPKVSGTSGDNEAVAIIEYSTNGGKDWLPVDTAAGIGGTSVSFTFTPLGLEDGNYKLMARAIDTSANIATTTAVDLVIDRLEPLVGGLLVSQGPQVLAPARDGTLSCMVGVSQRVTVSAVGGPTNITLIAVQTDNTAKKTNAKPQTFSLTKSADTGLWTGDVNFSLPGRYEILATAIDGAGNRTARVLGTAQVATPAQTINQQTKNGIISNVTLYYFEPAAKEWVVWDAGSYSQTNPQVTDRRGNFQFFLPPGKYYFKAEAKHYETLISSIFEMKQSSPFSTTLALKPLRKFGVGPLKISLPLLGVQNVGINGAQVTTTIEKQNPLANKTAPDFTLQDTNDSTVHTADLLGRPTLITFASTWMPAASEQLGTLDELQSNRDINVLPIALQENSSKTRAYTAIAGLNLRWLVDPDSTLSVKYGTSSLPTHYFLDRKGTVRKVETGVLTKPRILEILSSY